MWNGKTPTHAVVELRSEEDIRIWSRTAIYHPSKFERWHTLKVTSGTDRVNTRHNTVLCAYLEIMQMFSNKITIYVTNAGRLVTPDRLSYGLVKTVRDVRGNEVIRVEAPVAGPSQARDYRAVPPPAEYYQQGTNKGGLGLPTQNIIETRDGRKLFGNFHHSIHLYCAGTAIGQANELQMCRGRYKQMDCRHLTDCNN